MGTAIKHPVPDRIKALSRPFVIFDIRALWCSALSVRVPECQKLQMTGLIRSGTGCFLAVLIMATVGVKGLMYKREAAVFTETTELEDQK